MNLKTCYFSENTVPFKIYKHDGCHVTKMAAKPIYGTNPLKYFTQNQWNDFNETWYVASVTPAYHRCSIDDPVLTLTNFWQGQILQHVFLYRKM